MRKKTFTFVFMLLLAMAGTTTVTKAQNPFTVVGGTPDTDYKWESGRFEIKGPGAFTMSNTPQTDKTIMFDCGSVYANVTFSGVDINSSTASGLVVSSNTGTLSLTLAEGSVNKIETAGANDNVSAVKVDSYGILIIQGDGKLVAKNTSATHQGSGIGYYSGLKKITINGGYIIASSNNGAGIGIKSGASGTITIDGNTFIVTNSMNAQTINLRKGIVIVGAAGKIYGDPVIQQDVEIPAGATLMVGENQTLAVASGKKITNLGTIIIEKGGSYDANTIQGSGKVIDKNLPDPDPAPVPPVYYNWYNVSIPAAEGVTIVRNDREFDSYKIDVIEASSLSFSLQAKEGYDLTNVVVTTSRGEILTPREEDGRYLIHEVNEDVEVTIKGAVPLANEEINREGTAIYTADGQIFVEVPEAVTAYVYTSAGALKYSGVLSAGSNRISVSGASIYLVRLSNGVVKKVVL